MSKMGRAYQWICENGLEGDPDALKYYIERGLKTETVKPDANKNSETETEKTVDDSE
jgi:hypothetical protein